jgi:hypothetical protein
LLIPYTQLKTDLGRGLVEEASQTVESALPFPRSHIFIALSQDV